jgi:hypothetical protein
MSLCMISNNFVPDLYEDILMNNGHQTFIPFSKSFSFCSNIVYLLALQQFVVSGYT